MTGPMSDGAGLKYSDSMHTLKKIQEQEENLRDQPGTTLFKKGTSDFIRRRIDKDQGTDNYSTNQY